MAKGRGMKAAIFAVLAALALGGCASQVLTIRTVPDETPAADNAAAAANAAAFAEAAQTEATQADTTQTAAAQDGSNETVQAVPLVTPADAPPMYTYDPWERLNRFTYRFNARFDEAIFLPAANLYGRAPAPLRAGVHNFFSNLSEIDSVINYTLQWRLKYTLRSLGRLVINSTIGIGGLIDVATKAKLKGTPTGFATTLAKWGMHPGPYLVIPLLGPSTLRDGVGYLADYATLYEINVFDLYRGNVSWGLDIVDSVDKRSNIDFRYYSSGSPFEYERIRFLYVRRLLIEDQGLRSKDSKAVSQAGEPAGK
jgi:phospholipid-binding lipoprotein MlaA